MTEKRIIGFNGGTEEIADAALPEVSLGEISDEFQSMVKALEVDESIHEHLVKVDKRILADLAKLHKQFLIIKEEHDSYVKGMMFISSSSDSDPEAACKKINQLIPIRDDLYRKAVLLSDAIHKHCVGDIHELYSQVELEKKQRSSVQIVAEMLARSANSVVSHLDIEVTQQILEATGHKIAIKHNLKG